MKTLIIPDIHTNFSVVDKVVEKEKADRVCLLGDIFDQFYDTPQQNREAAKWLKGCGYDWCYGNHDLSYGFLNPDLKCSGYTVAKDFAINETMNLTDWEKGKFFIWVDDWLLTHAGLDVRHVPPLYGKEFKVWLDDQNTKARALLNSQENHWFWMAGKARGGSCQVGGLTWCDFDREFEPIPELRQIFGHTPQAEPAYYKHKGSENICLDTHLNHYILMEDGDYQVKVVDKDRLAKHIFQMYERCFWNERS